MVDRYVSDKRKAVQGKQFESLESRENNQETSANYHLFRAHRRTVHKYRDGAVRVGYFNYLLFGLYTRRGKQCLEKDKSAK